MGMFSKKKPPRVYKKLNVKEIDFKVDVLNNYHRDGNVFTATPRGTGHYVKGRKI